MITSFTQQLDLPELLFVIFALFFAGLVVYLQRESKREGYPMVEDIPTHNRLVFGFPEPPPPKTYRLLEGGTSTLPQHYPLRDLPMRRRANFPGAPLYPTGDPLLAGIGSGSYTLRRDEPFLLADGGLQLEPLRVATEYTCIDPDLDPRKMTVFGSDYRKAGAVADIWIDKESKILRYIEVALDGVAEHRLVPIFYTRIKARSKEVRVDCLTAAQLVKAPILRQPTRITAREEDRINGFFAGGYLYSVPLREALL